MKNSTRKSATYLFVLKNKTNNKGVINCITQRSYTVPYRNYISTKKKMNFSMGTKGRNPMGEELRPIPFHGILKKQKSSHGMKWNEIIPSHAEL